MISKIGVYYAALMHDCLASIIHIHAHWKLIFDCMMEEGKEFHFRPADDMGSLKSVIVDF